MKENKLYFNILDNDRKKILPLLVNFKNNFYLAGGTALALQLGHRDSIDFDFFTKKDFNNLDLKSNIEKVFLEHKINIYHLETNTLSCIIDDNIKLSFFTFKNKLISPLIDTEYLMLADKADILCMKLSAICGRSVNKDFIDIYFLLKDISLVAAIKMCENKMPTLNISVILKSLVYFNEMVEDKVKMFPGFEVKIDIIKKFLVKEVKNFVG